MLFDSPVIDMDGDRASVFLTPASAVIERRMPLIIAFSAGVLLAVSFIGSRFALPRPLVHLTTMLAFAVAAIPALSSVWESLRRLRIDIDVLMLLGAGLAAVIGSPFEGALLLFLFALSGALEEFALDRTQSAIVTLHNLVPLDAIVLRDSGPVRVPLNRIALGERVLVRPGDRVPLDGAVVEGASSVNEAAITGESVPRDKNIGDDVYAGTSNLNGRLVVRVTKSSRDTTLARILTLVTEARHQRAAVQRLIDRIGPVYSTSVIGVSIVAGVVLHLLFAVSGQESIRRAIAVLIVGSPCALIIATPVAYLAAIGAAARRGVLVKGGVYLEALARARVVVFDKTGTLTTGRVRLVEVICGDGLDEREVLRLAGAVESSSSHPLAAAVMQALNDRKLEPYPVQDLQYVPGEGASARSNGRRLWIGKPKSAADHIAPAHLPRFRDRVDQVYRGGRAASAFVVDGVPAVLAFEDTLRDNARETIQRLRDAGVRRVAMLTGDHESVASAIAAQLSVDEFHADLLPDAKVKAAEALRRKHGAIIMVGDGVNDAPTLAAADVGIAIGSIGADVALEAADIVLMNNNLDGVAWVHRQAQRTARIVRQNLTLAIGVIVVLACFAAAGQIPLPIAVIGHEGSTVLVALNALRLLRSSAAGN
ncbi:MAG: cation-translocating P-type ATPase [Phycisphaerales bacterium]|nr:cation-translocating P-type ATPase [Phycisphaerales bacterium]